MATRKNETNQLGGPGRTSNQGRKEASGGEQEQVGANVSESGGRKASSTTSRGGGKDRSTESKGGEKSPGRKK